MNINLNINFFDHQFWSHCELDLDPYFDWDIKLRWFYLNHCILAAAACLRPLSYCKVNLPQPSWSISPDGRNNKSICLKVGRASIQYFRQWEQLHKQLKVPSVKIVKQRCFFQMLNRSNTWLVGSTWSSQKINYWSTNELLKIDCWYSEDYKIFKFKYTRWHKANAREV